MNKLKLTPWFSHKIKPVHVGVYLIKRNLLGMYAFWDGKKWGISAQTPEDAIERSHYDYANQRKVWRGMAVKP